MVERNGSETLKTELIANLLYENIRIKTLQTISTVHQVIAGNPQQLQFTDGWETENLFYTKVPKCAVVFKPPVYEFALHCDAIKLI